ncbi:unnamed protein product, partial [Hapterophycus canaliculatus]
MRKPDEEARALVGKIRKINPGVDIASIVLQTTPRMPLLLQPLTRTGDNGCGVPRRPSSRGTPVTGTATTVASASAAPSLPIGVPPSSSKIATACGPRKTETLGEQSLPSWADPNRAARLPAKAGRNGEPETTKTAASTVPMRRTIEEEVAQAEEGVAPRYASEDEALACPLNHDRRDGADGGGRLPPAEGSSKVGREGENGGSDQSAGRSRRRSLMGRMLESGMLERQREWAKARRRKVLESRRQVEEAKAKEGKGDILDAGLSSRSWSKAKTQHLRSLERQRQEEEDREAIREARRRASVFRAERDREYAERRAVEIAQSLAAAENAIGAVTRTRSGRAGRITPNSRGAGGEGGGELPRSRRQPPPRRATSHTENDGANGSAEGSGSIETVAAGDRPRKNRETYTRGCESVSGDDPRLVVEANAHLSEDSFYRVAVEKIMEKERLSVGEAGDGGGGDGGGGDEGRQSRHTGRRHGRARKCAAADPSILASPRGVSTGRRSRRKASDFNVEPKTGVNVRGARRLPECRPRKYVYDVPSSQTHPAVLSGSYLRGEVARTSSLLSLYEAQSVEYPNACIGRAHKDNSGPYLDDDYAHAPSGVGRFASDSGAQASASAASAAPAAPGAANNTGGDRNLPPRREETDYPWSDERRAPLSSRTGGGARRGVVGGREIDVGRATVGKEPRRNRVSGRRNTAAYEGEEDANRAEEAARRQGWATGSGA